MDPKGSPCYQVSLTDNMYSAPSHGPGNPYLRAPDTAKVLILAKMRKGFFWISHHFLWTCGGTPNQQTPNQ